MIKERDAQENYRRLFALHFGLIKGKVVGLVERNRVGDCALGTRD